MSIIVEVICCCTADISRACWASLDSSNETCQHTSFSVSFGVSFGVSTGVSFSVSIIASVSSLTDDAAA